MENEQPKRKSFLQFHVLAPGLYTTIQDRGRFGYQKYGVPVTGVLDTHSAAIANFLVGNAPDCAVLEMTMVGPRLLSMNDALVAVTGADVEVMLNGAVMPRWQAFRIRPGDFLEIGTARSGCRGYLAVSGGIQGPLIMGSRSCYPAGGIGGLDGNPVRVEEKIKRGPGIFPAEPRSLPRELIPQHRRNIVLRALPGPQNNRFDGGLWTFFHSEFQVSADADRMGYRLEGPVIKQKEDSHASITSELSLPGSVQIPPNGQPIILLGEQTVGGYTKIATVISADLDLIGQASPGDRIRFREVDLETAYRLKKQKVHALETSKKVIDLMARLKNLSLQHGQNDHHDLLHRFEKLYPECELDRAPNR